MSKKKAKETKGAELATGREKNPMGTGTKILIGALVAVGVVAGVTGVVVLVKKAKAADNPKQVGPAPAPTPAGKVWKNVGANGAIMKGERVRSSIDAAALTWLMSQPGSEPGCKTGDPMKCMMAMATSAQAPGTSITTMAPGDPLPKDWPADDPSLAPPLSFATYHVDMTYGIDVTVMQPQVGRVMVWALRAA